MSLNLPIGSRREMLSCIVLSIIDVEIRDCKSDRQLGAIPKDRLRVESE